MRGMVSVTYSVQLNTTYHHGAPQNMNYRHGALLNTNYHHGALQQPDQVPQAQQNTNNIHLRGYEIALEIGSTFKIVILQTGSDDMQSNPIFKPPANQKIGVEVEVGQTGRKGGERFMSLVS